jgi:CRISPR-associated endonuclease/helicase Cas3
LTSFADPDLVLHLVATHHGRCRPFAPVIDERDPIQITYVDDGHRLSATSETGLTRLDSGLPDRFWRLIRRYGWWGLAYLEALVICADHLVSAAERSATARVRQEVTT